MHKWVLSVLVFTACANVLAQAKPLTGPVGESESAREQRRVELRSALHGHRDPARPVPEETAPVSRHLTAQQRAEMRQQLRQYQPDKSARP